MPQFVILLWAALVTVLWVGILAGIWAILSVREEYPPEVSKTPTNE